MKSKTKERTINSNKRVLPESKNKLEIINEQLERDINEYRKAEKRQKLIAQVMETLNKTKKASRAINNILGLIKKNTEFEAVGIRLKKGEDFPYYATDGFSAGFIEAEKYLCERDGSGIIARDAEGRPCLACMCGNIIRARIDPALPFFSEGGSFWTNCTTELLKNTTENDRQARTRNRCNREGYESVALIPLRAGEQTIGLLQLNDRRKGMFTPESIEFFEGLGASIGVALKRKQAEEALKQARDELQLRVKERTAELTNTIDRLERVIVERKEAEAKVLSLSKFPSENPYPVLRIAKDGRLLYANEVSSSLLSEWKCKTGHRVPDKCHKLVIDALDSAASKNIEIEHRDRILSFSVVPIVNEAYVNWYGRDVTERKQADERLRRSEDRYRSFIEMAPDGIVTADTKGMVTSCNRALAAITGYPKDEIVGKHFAKLGFLQARNLPEFVKRFGSLARGQVPAPLELECIRKDGSIINLEAHDSLLKNKKTGKIEGIQGIIRDITERKEIENERRQSFEKMRGALDGTVRALASTTEMRDPYTAGHQQRVSKLSCAVAKEMDLLDEQIEGIKVAGLIHDVGKLLVPAEILSKPGKLSEMEMGIIKAHPQAGYNIIKNVDFPWPVAQIVLEHHERMNGSGYPSGILGEDIFLEARILAVADVVEAMASHRPYRPARGIKSALEEISQNKSILYDPNVAEACLKLFNKKKFTFE